MEALWNTTTPGQPQGWCVSFVEALIDGIVTDPETERRYLTTIQKEILKHSALIDDLFQIAQLDAGSTFKFTLLDISISHSQ